MPRCQCSVFKRSFQWEPKIVWQSNFWCLLKHLVASICLRVTSSSCRSADHSSAFLRAPSHCPLKPYSPWAILCQTSVSRNQMYSVFPFLRRVHPTFLSYSKVNSSYFSFPNRSLSLISVRPATPTSLGEFWPNMQMYWNVSAALLFFGQSHKMSCSHERINHLFVSLYFSTRAEQQPPPTFSFRRRRRIFLDISLVDW